MKKKILFIVILFFYVYSYSINLSLNTKNFDKIIYIDSPSSYHNENLFGND
jgi:hypothetical protein